eukprot:1252728-Lingulodinium_polyedra.AAC.1
MDLVAQRVREIRLAKSQGGSWGKAEVVTPTLAAAAANAPFPDGVFMLRGEEWRRPGFCRSSS